MGRSSQRKGRDAERELTAILKAQGYDVRPGVPLSFGTEPDIVGLPGIHAEVKRHERWELPAWIKQAEQDAARMRDGAPAVFFRSNRQPWMVAMHMDDFLRFYTAWTDTLP